MAYGLKTKEQAEIKAEVLRVAQPECKFEVAPHSYVEHGMRTLYLEGPQPANPLTWGVTRYVPYCEQMPWRFDGFVWF